MRDLDPHQDLPEDAAAAGRRLFWDGAVSRRPSGAANERPPGLGMGKQRILHGVGMVYGCLW